MYTIYEPLRQARASWGTRQAWERADVNGEGTPDISFRSFADAEAIVEAVPVETIATFVPTKTRQSAPAPQCARIAMEPTVAETNAWTAARWRLT
ncbi:MAG: hypothetical protein Q9195_000885 [Heterodermia aff. obscurata]